MNRYILLILFLILAIYGCNSRQSVEQSEGSKQTELPPSLKSGSELKFIELSEQQQKDLQISTVTVISRVTDHSLVAPGVVFPAPAHASIISTPINGQISEIMRHEGDRVRKDQILFKIQSLEFGNLVSDYLQAYAEEQYQTNRLDRIKQLVEETISSVSELERTTAEYERASVSVRAAYSKLKAIGVSDREIDIFTKGENIAPMLSIHSPISGIVEQNFVELGQSVNALENLSRILDTRVVLIRGYVSPDDARLISKGDPVTISRREEDFGLSLRASVTSINPGLDENSRSVVVNIIVESANGWPKPGEQLRLKIVSSGQKEIISIPVKSLTYDEDQAVVFVEKDKGVYEKRPITVSVINDEHVVVKSGLFDGEKVATSNIFSLKALSRYDIISED